MQHDHVLVTLNFDLLTPLPGSCVCVCVGGGGLQTKIFATMLLHKSLPLTAGQIFATMLLHL